MIDQQTSIEPPPSIEAILTHRERIGRVDFTHRLTPEVPVAPETVEPATTAVAPAPTVEELTGGTAESARPEDRRPEEHQPETHHPEPEVSAVEAVEHDDECYLDPPLTSFDEARLAAHPAMREREQPVLHPDADAAPADHLPRREASEQVTQLLSLVPAEDAGTVVEDVEEIVEGVLGRIREAQHATAAHLEATEIEAALRCEMLTAQAELDAELIRLHARREAHAIIAAARQRAGLPQPVYAEHQRRRLDQLGEAAMRLAEELETLDRDTASTDHPFRR